MSGLVSVTTMVEASPVREGESRWRSARRWGPLFAGVWLIFLISPIVDAIDLGTVRGYAGAVVLVAFGGTYLIAARAFRSVVAREQARSRTTTTIWVGAMLGLALAAVALLGTEGLSTAPYVAVLGPIVFGRWAVAWVFLVAGFAELTYRWIAHTWTDTQGLATGTLSAGLAVWGFVLVLQRNIDQARSREVEAQLALISERDRFARDLHDILGHSLTVITVKAELAGRLLEASPERARSEVADLERLSREALADVRRAVAGYREISLAAEIVRAHGALSSAGIEPQAPTEIPALPSDVDEMFAWTVREGVTNVLRHSRASHCRISVTPASLVITDDGRGVGPAGAPAEGNGLRGLRERARLAGVELRVEPAEPRGTRLEVLVPDLAPSAEPTQEVLTP